MVGQIIEDRAFRPLVAVAVVQQLAQAALHRLHGFNA